VVELHRLRQPGGRIALTHDVASMPGLWGESLYAGSADHYRIGRLPYPQRLAAALREQLGLDGEGRLLDLGCGPGSLTILLAPLFAHVLAVDADAEMVRVARADADRQGIDTIDWLHGYAEDLPDDLGLFTVVTLAQSFHWMDRPVVASKIRRWLTADGCCVHVGATTHESAPGVTGLPHPTPPREQITELIRAYLGPHRRAGQKVIAGGETLGDEEAIFRAAGFTGPDIIAVPGGDVFDRTEDQVIASVLSLSSAAPHLFGERLSDFVEELRRLLRSTAADGVFSEQLQDIRLFLWR
jgi:SAM-dependent methyltransferase